MSAIALTAEHVSKYYSLEKTNVGSLKRALQDFLKPKLSENNTGKGIWALSDIHFEIKKGEAVAFLGNNGAGKSTLLRILSRVTLPTKGVLRGRGTMASLLEVGTGFHPELTGMENIFMNGNLLGMTNTDIRQRLEEIIAFSGVEAFLDTPVKRYSSGMYVRLAFAVAAHLDPDVLVVDEALAVGDVAFQHKCLAKMRAIAEDKDKTILFVSHDMGAIQKLCTRAFWLEKGSIKGEGSPEEIVRQYLSVAEHQLTNQDFEPATAPGNEWIRLNQIRFYPTHDPATNVFDSTMALSFSTQFQTFFDQPTPLQIEWVLFTFAGTVIQQVFSVVQDYQKGKWEISYQLPSHLLNVNAYCISLVFRTKGEEVVFQYRHTALFDIQTTPAMNNPTADWPLRNHGVLVAAKALIIQPC